MKQLTKMDNATQLEIRLPSLHPVQEKIRSGMRRFTVVRAGRQIGKSWLASNLAIEKAFAKPNQFILVLAPTYRQTEAIYGRIRRLLKPLINQKIDGEIVVSENKSDRRLDFYNGSTILAATADSPDRLRGYSIHFVILDEAAMVPSNEIWVEVLRPALAATRGSALFISTPKGKSNWFYDLWKWGEADTFEKGEESDWALFHFKSTDSPFFPEEEAQEARKLGENVYLQEYEAEFTVTANMMIGIDQFHYFTYLPIGDEIYLSYAGEVYPQTRLFRVMTVDLAVKKSASADYTAFAIGDLTGTGIAFVRDVYRERIEGHKLATEILKYANRHKVSVIYVENVAFQLAVIQGLAAMGASVKPIPAKGDKIARATLLGVRMSAEQVLYQQGAAWLPSTVDEVTAFPDGAHDDRVDALAYLAHVAAEHARYAVPGVTAAISLDMVKRGRDAGIEIDIGDVNREHLVKLLTAKAKVHKQAGGMALEKLRGPM